MNVVDLLASLAKLDIRLWLEGENLRFNAPEGVFTGEIREQVISRKAEIIAFLKQARKLNEQPIPVIGRDGPLPVSYSQQRLWVLDRLNPHDVTYNMTSALRIRGALNFAVLEKVFATLVQRHESLRTRFVEVDGEPFQIIDAFNGWQLPHINCVSLPADQLEARVQQAVDEFALSPYDLTTGPLFRAQVLKLADDHHVLIAGMHHVISDAWSMDVMVKEIGALYFAFSSGMASPLPPLAIQYADYASWQRDQINAAEMEKHQQYWVKTLTGAPPVLDIPTDRPRQDIPSNNGALFKLPVPDDLARKINQACTQQDLTPFMFFLGAWQMLLGRFAGSQDVVIGAPTAGRSRGEVQEIIGFFVNLLLMRLDLSGDPSVKTVLQRVKEMVLSAFTHQDMPIDRVMEVMAFERQPGYPPLAQSMFQLLNMNEEASGILGNGAMSLEPIPAPHVTARMDLVLGVAKLEDRYQLSMEYNTDLFNESTIVDMLQSYLKVLGLFVGNPEQRVNAFRLRDDRELLAHLGFDASQHRILPLNDEQRAVCSGVALAACVAIRNEIDADALAGAMQSLANELPVLRARRVVCDWAGADDAYWVIPAARDWKISRLSIQGTDVADLEQKLLTLPPLKEQGVELILAVTGNGQSNLAVRCLQGLLDSVSLQWLAQAIVAIARGEARPGFVVAATDVKSVSMADIRDPLQAVEPLHFSRPGGVARDAVRGCQPRIESVALDHRQRDAIAEFCSAHGLDLADYFRMLFSLMLQHYCRPEAAFAFRETVGAGRAEIGFSEVCCPVITPQELLHADVTLQQWFAVFARSGSVSSAPPSVLDQLLPQGATHFHYEFLNSDITLVKPVAPGAVQLLVQNGPTGVSLKLFFDEERFASLQFLQRVLHISEQIVFGDPERVRDLTFLSSGELYQLQDFACGNEQTTEKSVVALFADQVARTPDKIALVFGQQILTYRQLEQRSNQLAHLLVNKGVCANERVGVCLNRSPDLVVAILAVLKAGGAYIPMDPAYPRERLAFMVADSAASLIITRGEYSDVLGSCPSEQVLLDQLQADLAGMSDSALQNQPQPDDQIYVIYTSGSTGQPKGAMVCHRGESNLQHWYLSALKLGEQDSTLLVSAVGFDLTQKNIFAPLLAGGTLVLPAMELFDEGELLVLIEQHNITWINCAPSALYPLVESSAMQDYQSLQSLRYVVLGGEPIRMNALFPWLSHAQCKAQVVNSYGPTECTDVVSWHCAERIESPQQILPIGRPVNGTQVYVLNDFLNPVVPGLAGEICVAGVGVGLGYINRPDITAAAFVKNPFGEGNLYRTGDLGRYLPNGEIDYIGRKDFQIKLRGLRIELGEIEFALKQLPDVQDALVLVKDETLLGYVVAGTGFAGCDWRTSLRDYLPEYMIPAFVLALDTWPLTPNGKIDRKALPDVSAADKKAIYVAPRNETESVLAAIWQELLQRESVGVLDDLFALGGNSLTATRILSRIKKQFGVQVSVRQLFMGPTIADLAVAVERAQQLQSIPPIVPVDHSIPQPLSFAQQRLWFLDQFDPGSLAYSMPGAFRIHGEFDVDVFEQAVKFIVNRHAVLRSQVVLVDEQPCQLITQADSWTMARESMSGTPADTRHDVARSQVLQWRRQGFDLADDALFRVTLIAFDRADHLLLVNMHHIVSDGWSNGILLREIGMLYDAFLHQRPSPLPRLPIQYIDFAQWQRNWLNGGELERQVAYWRRQLAGVEVLNLPTSTPRTADTGYSARVARLTFDASLTRRLQSFCAAQGVTLYMALLSGYVVLLSKSSGQSDIAVGTPIANRHFEEVEPLIGFFVNTLVMRAQVESQMSFQQVLDQVRSVALDAYAHQDIPFEKLVEELVQERSTLHSPLFQVMFSVQNVPFDRNVTIGGTRIETLIEQDTNAKFDLSLSLVELGDEIVGEMVYRQDLFSPGAIQLTLECFQRIVETAIAQPDMSVGSIDLLSPTQKQQVKALATRAMLPAFKPASVADVWQRCVSQLDTQAAVEDGNTRWTYRELDVYSNRIAAAILQQGIKKGSLIGIFLPRSAQSVLSILSIWKAGCAYVPLDVEYPEERLRYLLEDSAVPLVITNEDNKKRVAQLGGRKTLQIDECMNADSNETTFTLDPASLAYVIYTSGTTGRPKGVCIRHESVENLRLALNERIYDQCATPINRVGINASFSFDASVKQIIQLFSGRTLLPVPNDVRLDAEALKHWLQVNRIDGFDCTPSQLQALVAVVSEGEWLTMPRCVLIGGEAISPAFWSKLSRISAMSGVRFVNVYGPTECTVDVTAHTIDETSPVPMLGAPLRNYGAWILGRGQEFLPPGFVGELCVSGVGVASGYLNRPELTTEKFIEPGKGSTVPARFYRTGDLAYCDEQGNITYVGRGDNQIKIRGYRIELEEIENIISSHSAVKQSAVKVMRHGNIDLLCGFVVLGDGESLEDANTTLRSWMQGQAPDYMVPAAFVTIDVMPLTPHGKINRQALTTNLDEAGQGRSAYVAPESDTEKQVAAIWQEVLGVNRIGIHDHFFELGGHSLMATKVVSRLRAAFQVELPLRQLFEQPTIASISHILDSLQHRNQIAPPLVQIEPRTQYPLSFAQQRLWMLDRIEQGSAAYNMPAAVILEGDVDPGLLQAVLDQIVQRHGSLRTVFVDVDGEGQQRVVDDLRINLQIDQHQGARDMAALKSLVQEEASQPFDLEIGPLIRARLVELAGQQWLLVVTLHHIIADGWSVGVLINEVAALYGAAASGRDARLAPLPVQYVDFAVWQQSWLQGDVLEGQLNYWKSRLVNQAPMELPTDKTRPPLQSYRGDHVSASVNVALTSRVNTFAQQQRATLFMVLMSAFNVLLARYSRSDDIVVGTPIANRTESPLEPLIGFFVNVLAIRTQISSQDSFAQLVQQVRQTTIDAYDHQHVPFERLIEVLNVKRDLSRTPVFQVMFILQNTRDGVVASVDNLHVKPFQWEQNVSKYDLTLSVREADGKLQLDFEYCADLFHRSSIEAMAEHFTTLLDAACQQPELPVGQLNVLPDSVRDRVLQDWNRTASSYAQDTPVTRVFEAQALQVPQQAALVIAGSVFSYADLNGRANRLAHYLLEKGLQPGQFVGVMCERSVDMLASLLAILKVGASYIPLDPEYPLSRIQYVVSDAKPAFVLTQSVVAERVPLADTALLSLDQLEQDIQSYSDSNPAVDLDTAKPAYVIYTSGSTGNPKGVVIPQAAFINFIHGMNETIGIQQDDRLLAVTSLSFDIAGLELFMPLLSGATVVMATADEARDAERLLGLMQSENISFMQATPATWHMLVQEDWKPAPGFKVLCGGEPMPVALANILLEKQVALYNVYGPTETTVWSTVYKVESQLEKSVPIGRPITNTSIYVLDEFMQPVPVGVPGELYIGGHGVALGYLNRPDLTAERFVANPFDDGLSDRIYRTGDLVRYLPDGNIECMGRLDHQVKIRGFRIELGEIEAILNSHPRVNEGIVHYHTDANGTKYLVGYIVSDEPINVAEVRAFLSIKLPDYMVPTSYVFLTEMPLTPNGKVDRKALPEPDDSQQLQHEYVAPKTQLEQEIAVIWEQVLGRDQVGVKDHFFEIGGHSLLAMKVISRIRQQYNIEIPVKSLFEVSTVEGMANYIENVMWARGDQPADTDAQDDDLEELEI